MASKQDHNKCATKFCKRTARKFKTKKGIRFGKHCTTCDKKKWRANNPMKAAYQTLRQNTRRRSKQQGKPKPFTITFEDFKKFCYETNYMAGKGRNRLSYSIDCIIEELGYVPGNLQKLPVPINSQKEQARRKNKTLIYDWQTGTATVV